MSIHKLIALAAASILVVGCSQKTLPDPEPTDTTYGGDSAGATTDAVGGDPYGGGEFMDDPSATDVITFQHGEAFISTDTAARCGAEVGHATEREVGLYLTHALLHLNGHEDADAGERETMRVLQERILNVLWDRKSE